MIPARLLPETVTWLRPIVTADRYGNTAYDWSTPVASDLQARIDQTGADDVNSQTGTAAVGQWRLLTNELGVDTRHRIVRDDVTFEIDGPPSIVFTPAGPHHLEAKLMAVQT